MVIYFKLGNFSYFVTLRWTLIITEFSAYNFSVLGGKGGGRASVWKCPAEPEYLHEVKMVSAVVPSGRTQ